MRYRIERAIDKTGYWVVLDARTGDLVSTHTTWCWAVTATAQRVRDRALSMTGRW